MKILLVGAGSVGISYGYALARGGAAITFFIRDRYRQALEGGVNVYPLRRRGERHAERLTGYGLATTPDEVRTAGPFDQVWLCVSSPALRGDWLGALLGAAGDDATVVVLQPGSRDVEHVAALAGGARVVSGVITLVAYETPLPGETPHPPGTAVWLPPLAAFPVTGPKERAAGVIAALRRGGWRARWQGATTRAGGAMASGVLLPHVAAMEGGGWTIAGLKEGGWGQLAARASREAMTLIAALRGKGRPLSRALVGRRSVGTFLRLAQWKAPFDFEVYFERHFTKVRLQTEEALDAWIDEARARGLPHEAMSELRERVFGAAG
jgi:hypothetical protein